MARGSISDRRKRGRGWEARWYTTDKEGKRHQHSKSFVTKDAAEEYLIEVLGAEARGESSDPRRRQLSFEALAKSWLETLDGNVKPKTLAGYKSILKEHLLPAFGHRAVGGIQPDDIDEFVAGLKARSPGTRRNIIRVLNPIMNKALRQGRIRLLPGATRVRVQGVLNVPASPFPSLVTSAPLPVPRGDFSAAQQRNDDGGEGGRPQRGHR